MTQFAARRPTKMSSQNAALVPSPVWGEIVDNGPRATKFLSNGALKRVAIRYDGANLPLGP
jgi:hypothetical protein